MRGGVERRERTACVSEGDEMREDLVPGECSFFIRG